jgi:hypothetical protein
MGLQVAKSEAIGPKMRTAGVCNVDAGCESSVADRHHGGGPERRLDSSPGRPVSRWPPLPSLTARVPYRPMAGERSEGLDVVGWHARLLAEIEKIAQAESGVEIHGGL